MRNLRLGIVGGGQLGMLLLQKAMEFPVQIGVMDPDPNCSAAPFTQNFTNADLGDYESVLKFGRNCDSLIFEIDKCNAEALLQLEAEGKTIISSPKTLQWIQDKGLQRKRLDESGFPCPKYQILDAGEISDFSGELPVVQKIRRGGYDGQGVVIHKNADSLKNAPKVDSVFEEFITIKHELAVLLARDKNGVTLVYPPCELFFTKANLVDFLVAPAQISNEILSAATELCQNMAAKLDFIGVYAVELFVDANDKLFVNEISPRVHNSGHHTCMANLSSQYEQAVRMACGLPLGSIDTLSPALLMNLLGEGPEGDTQIHGLEEALKIQNVHSTFYGKAKVRQDRKMGHMTILDKSTESAIAKMHEIKKILKINSSNHS